jgi:ATP-dependent DNA helicase DinG
MERQMSVFVASDLPEPGQRGHIEALAELLRGLHVALGGSVLTLFTNRRDLDALYRRLAPELDEAGLKLIAQTRGSSAKRVAEQFIADERMSLFATKSFWEGFDAKGDTLRCVTVARLPFGVPSDPVMAELKDRDPANWWSERYLPEAILELKQAAGRLIRSSTDEGCIVIADSRLASARPYARDFLRALPVSDVELLPAERLLEEVKRRFGR